MKTKSRFELIKEFKEDVKEYYLDKEYSENDLIDLDVGELAMSKLSVYYTGLIDQANELEGYEWKQVWLYASELRADSSSPYDTIQDNLYMLYVEIYHDAIFELKEESKQLQN